MFELADYPLKYERNALIPYMSEETVNLHYGKHLDTYIKNLNGLIPGTKYEKMSLEDIVKESAHDENAKKIFNNAGQISNHALFFAELKKDSGTKIPKKISDAFGGEDKFKEAFKTAATGLFGSGWVWVIEDKGEIKITTTTNADTPVVKGQKTLLALDVWEHAYYLDYQNRRGDFVDAFLNHLVDWDFVEERM